MRSKSKIVAIGAGLLGLVGLILWVKIPSPPPPQAGPDPTQITSARGLLTQINHAYEVPVTLAVDYQVLHSPESEEILDAQRGIVVRQDDLQYWRIGDMEVLQTNGLIVSADPSAHELTLRDAIIGTSTGTDAAALAATVEQQLDACIHVKVDRSERGLQRINLDCPASRFSHIELEVDEPRALLRRIVLDTRETTDIGRQTERPRMVINYQPLDTIPDDVHLSLEQFVRQQGDVLIPGGAYEGFTLVDLRAR